MDSDELLSVVGEESLDDPQELNAERAAHAETLRVLGELVDVVETHMEWSPRREWGHRFSEREVPRIARRHLRKHERSAG